MKTRFLASLFVLLLAIAPALADQSTLSSPTTGTVSGLQLTNNYNNALNALNTCNSGASAPANQLSGSPSEANCWLDTSSAPHRVKIFDGTAGNWLLIGYIDATNHIWTPVVAGGAVNTVASGATTDLCSTQPAYVQVSGVTTITSFGSNCQVGQLKWVTFTGGLTLTHNGTSLILPNNGANITTVAGDAMLAVYLGSGNWKVPFYTKVNGTALSTAATVTTHGDSDYTILSTDQNVLTSAALTLSRTWTLPSASAFGSGRELKICDEANGVTSTNTLTVARAGADTIVLQGTTVNSYILTNAGACTALFSDGTSKWLVYSQRMVSQFSTLTSGTGATYNTPSGATSLKVRMVGGGGGGAATSVNVGGNGSASSFGSWTANAGQGGGVSTTPTGGAGGTGGTNSTGVLITRFSGGQGSVGSLGGSASSAASGGDGAATPFAGNGTGAPGPSAGQAAQANTGSGGGGAGNNNNGTHGAGGGGGEYVEFMIPAPAATYTYTVGGGGSGGAAGGFNGGNGAAGVIIVEAVFN